MKKIFLVLTLGLSLIACNKDDNTNSSSNNSNNNTTHSISDYSGVYTGHFYSLSNSGTYNNYISPTIDDNNLNQDVNIYISEEKLIVENIFTNERYVFDFFAKNQQLPSATATETYYYSRLMEDGVITEISIYGTYDPYNGGYKNAILMPSGNKNPDGSTTTGGASLLMTYKYSF